MFLDSLDASRFNEGDPLDLEGDCRSLAGYLLRTIRAPQICR